MVIFYIYGTFLYPNSKNYGGILESKKSPKPKKIKLISNQISFLSFFFAFFGTFLYFRYILIPTHKEWSQYIGISELQK